MIPDLGSYAGTVLAAYGVTLALLIGLIGVSLVRAARVRRALARIERDAGRTGHGRA